MPILKSIQRSHNPDGTPRTYEYWCLKDLSFKHDNKTGFLLFVGFKDKATKIADSKINGDRILQWFNVSEADYNAWFSVAAFEAMETPIPPQKQAYLYAKTLPFFSGWVDVDVE